MRTVWGDHERFVKTLFQRLQGTYYFFGATALAGRRPRKAITWINRPCSMTWIKRPRAIAMGTAEVESSAESRTRPSATAARGRLIRIQIKGQGI